MLNLIGRRKMIPTANNQEIYMNKKLMNSKAWRDFIDCCYYNNVKLELSEQLLTIAALHDITCEELWHLLFSKEKEN